MSAQQPGDGQIADGSVMPLATASQLRRGRRQVRSWVRSRLGRYAPWLGYVYLALVLVCAIEVSTALGTVGLVLAVPFTWICGLWVFPGGEDAYVLAVSNTLHNCKMQVGQAQRRHAAENDRIATAILASLLDSLELHQRLSSVLGHGPENGGPARERMYARMIFSHEQFIVLKETLAQIENKRDDRASVVQAKLTTLLDAKQVANHEFLDALSEERARLAKAKPPPILCGFHNSLLDLCDQYRNAVAVCYEAIEGDRADSLQQAAHEVCDLWQIRQGYSQAVAERLRECFW